MIDAIHRELDRAATVVFADGPDGADIVPAALADADALSGRPVVVGWLPGTRSWTAHLDGATALMGGYALRDALRDGRAEYVPVRLSAIPRLLASLPRPIVAVVRGRAAGDGWCFGPSVGWAPAAAALADAVVVEVDSSATGPPAVPAPAVPGRIIGSVEGTATRVAPDWPEPDAVDHEIAARVVAVLPPSPTLQYGPGPLLDAVIRAVDRTVGFISGLVTDAVTDLARDGRLREPAVTGYLWGGDALHELTLAGQIRLAPVEETHDVGRLAAVPQFVAVNTALQVALDGSVNVERIGSEIVGGVGGHADFARGASACADGLSVVVLRSTHRGDSTIVPSVPAVTTARTDIDLVVTEHGVADLRGRTDAERARLLAAIAHPDHRDALESHARAGTPRAAEKKEGLDG
jgi:acyl-CoA hydrolase